ncbi:MAG TPA: hypothetical protein VF981_16660 [Gemmatimonadaceae bacterium]
MSGVHRALDRLRFGPRRTLNVRDRRLNGAEAARRVDGWLRAKQVEFEGDVLLITGRGAGSRDGIAVIRDATQRTLRGLKRCGVVASIQEDTAGSFVVTLAPLRALFEAPARRKRSPVATPAPTLVIEGIGASTSAMLQELAGRSLLSLGVVKPSHAQLRDEMERQFSLLVRGAPGGSGTDAWLNQAITRCLEEYEEHK